MKNRVCLFIAGICASLFVSQFASADAFNNNVDLSYNAENTENGDAPPELNDKVFNLDWYWDHNLDIRNNGFNTKQLAITHWLKYGIFEGRQSSEFFSVQTYCKNYPDLQRIAGPKDCSGPSSCCVPGANSPTNWDYLIRHYIEYGISEHRCANPKGCR